MVKLLLVEASIGAQLLVSREIIEIMGARGSSIARSSLPTNCGVHSSSAIQRKTSHATRRAAHSITSLRSPSAPPLGPLSSLSPLSRQSPTPSPFLQRRRSPQITIFSKPCIHVLYGNISARVSCMKNFINSTARYFPNGRDRVGVG